MKLALCSAAALSIFFATGCSLGEGTNDADTVVSAEEPAGISTGGGGVTNVGNARVVLPIRVAPIKTVPPVKDVRPFIGNVPTNNASNSDEAATGEGAAPPYVAGE
jgi:hypothetical protein